MYTVYINEYQINGYNLFMAIFPRLDAGNYEALIPSLRKRTITIFSNRIIEVDVRNEIRI